MLYLVYRIVAGPLEGLAKVLARQAVPLAVLLGGLYLAESLGVPVTETAVGFLEGLLPSWSDFLPGWWP